MSVRDLPHKTQQREYIGARQPIVSAVYCLAAVSHLAVLAVFFFFFFFPTQGEMLMFVPSYALEA